MMSMQLKMLLMGKTGNGKSEAGNFILGKKHFATSSGTRSITKTVAVGFAEFGDYILIVVDGPGLEDTNLNKAKDKEEAVQHMSIALGNFYGDIDAFLFVLRFGIRFTDEEKSALDALKRIFGDNYMDHVIVVVTCGDMFEMDMKDEPKVLSFHEWCDSQTGEFRQLYEDCRRRFVLFNNREKDKEKRQTQLQELVQRVLDLRDQFRPYTSTYFKDAERERKKLILELKTPQLTLEFQEKLNRLNADLMQFIIQPSYVASVIIHSRIVDLKREIEYKDQGFGVFKNLKKQVEQVEENLNDVYKLQLLNSELEDIRKTRNTWTVCGSTITIAGGIMCCVAAPDVAISTAAAVVAFGGGAGAVGGGVTTGISRLILGSKEKQNREKQNKIKDKIKKRLNDCQD